MTSISVTGLIVAAYRSGEDGLKATKLATTCTLTTSKSSDKTDKCPPILKESLAESLKELSKLLSCC
jgi:hypothetical protein